jgi:hypothetical protein
MSNQTLIYLPKLIQSKRNIDFVGVVDRASNSMPLAAHILEASNITSQSLINQLLFGIRFDQSLHAVDSH